MYSSKTVTPWKADEICVDLNIVFGKKNLWFGCMQKN